MPGRGEHEWLDGGISTGQKFVQGSPQCIDIGAGGGLALAGVLHVGLMRGIRRAAGAGNITDERDAAVIARAAQITLMIVLLAVLGANVALWIGYRAPGQVPVGWTWYIGYGTVICAFLVHSITTVLVDAGMGGNAGE